MGSRLSTATIVLALLFANALYAPPVEAASFSSIPAAINSYINDLINFFGDLFNSPAPLPPPVPVPVVTHETTPPSPTTSTTVINRTVYLPATSSPAVTASGVTQAQLTEQLTALQSAIEAQIPTPTQAIVYDTAPRSDSGQTLTNLTVSGVTGLTAADIPALAYLPTAGGTLTGALINSSAATSTFAGSIGIGTTTPATTLSVAGNGYLTGGLGVGVENTVAGSIQTNGPIIVPNGSSNYVGANPNYNISFISGETDINASTQANININDTGVSTNAFNVFTGAANGAGTRLFTILKNGNVGIGTTNPQAALDLSGSSASQQSVLDLKGTDNSIFGEHPAQLWEIADGSVSTPVTTVGSTFKISRYDNVASTTCLTNNGLPNKNDSGCDSALEVSSFSGSTGDMITNGILAGAESSRTAPGADAIALSASGRVEGSGVGIGTGAYLEGFRSTTTGAAEGAELTAWNDTSSDCNPFNSAGFSNCTGLWVASRGNESTFVKDSVAMAVGVGDGLSQWLTGLGFITNSVASTTIDDESSSGTSIKINGTHTYALITGNTAGLVGIGTTTPATTLSVSGNGYFTGALGIGVFNTLAGSIMTNGPVVVPGGSANYVGANPNYNISFISGETDINASTQANININDTGVSTNAFNIFTGALDGAGTKLFTVLQNGNVGIGTTTPSNLLDIYSTGNGNQLLLEGNGNNVSEVLRNYGTGGMAWNINSSDNNASYGGGKLTIDNGGSEFMTINSFGNVGIGTTSPYAQLSVSNNLNTAINTPLFTITSTTGGTATSTLFTVLPSSGGGSPNGFVGVGTVSNTSGASVLMQVNGNFFAGLHYSGGGTTAFPGFAFSNTNYPGIYSPATNVLGFATNATERLRIDASGNVGIGTTTPYSRLEVWGPDTASTSAFTVVNNASTTEFAVYDTGNAVLSGGLTQNSDQRLKTDVQSLDASSSLAEIEALNPVSYQWVDNIFGGGQQLGFIAQDVQKLFPQLVSTTSPTALTPGGTLGLNYSGLIAPIIGAIQGITHITGDFQANLIAWLGSASNGINDLFANTTHQQRLCVGTPGNETCITKAQLDALLAGQNAQGTAGQGSAAPTSTGPTITLLGDNPVRINVGATYVDPDVMVIGPADSAHPYQTFINGMAADISSTTISTAVPTTYIITYKATDASGNTATATRTVIVGNPDGAVTATSTPPAVEQGSATTTPPAIGTQASTTPS